MKKIPIMLVFCNVIAHDPPYQPNSLKVKYVQVTKTSTYSDVKKRIASCVSKIRETAIDVKSLRLWWVKTDDYEFLDSVKKVQTYLQNDSPMGGWTGETEENTGIECGNNKSVEPYCGSSLTVEEKMFVNEAICVEVAKGEDQFAFKYTKRAQVRFGKCEWDN